MAAALLAGAVGCDQRAAGALTQVVPGRGGPPVAVSQASASPSPARCVQGTDPFLLPLERAVAPGATMRLLVVSERPLGSTRLFDGEGTALEATPVLTAGPPYARLYSARAPRRPGAAQLRLLSGPGADPADAPCVAVPVDAAAAAKPRHAPASGIWRITRSWDDGWERAFSAWVAWLFRPLPGQRAGWRPLQQVLRNPARNLLHDVLGLGEDSGRAPSTTPREAMTILGLARVRARGSRRGRPAVPRVVAWADCGDTPYQLRAYFAWKHGLPFRFRQCTRGTGTRGPRCPVDRDNRYPAFDGLRHPVRRFNAFLREGIAWQVHSGTTRTLPEDEASDFFPIRLSRDTIRPGTIFVDVGGHVLVVTQWDREGLFAIDGHPDFSVTRRHFSDVYFRFFRGTRTGGFKAFRPLRLEGDRIVPVPNRAVAPAFSVEQYRFPTGRAFYQTMGRLLARYQG